MISGATIAEGDTLLALPSSGLHSNGFSLVRKLIKPEEKDLLLQALTPTRIYWKAVKNALPHIKGMAHITGGGLLNIPRMGDKFDYIIEQLPAWSPLFAELAKRSNLDDKTLYETFNMGIGLVIATDKPDDVIKALGEPCLTLGHVVKGSGVVKVKTADRNFEVA